MTECLKNHSLMRKADKKTVSVS